METYLVNLDEEADALEIEVWNGERKVTAFIQPQTDGKLYATLIVRDGDEKLVDCDDAVFEQLRMAWAWIRGTRKSPHD